MNTSKFILFVSSSKSALIEIRQHGKRRGHRNLDHMMTPKDPTPWHREVHLQFKHNSIIGISGLELKSRSQYTKNKAQGKATFGFTNVD